MFEEVIEMYVELSRRNLLGSAGAAALALASGARGARAADAALLPLSIAARSPWYSNAVAVTSRNALFVGLPRWPGHEITPSVARLDASGALQPFPGNGWNAWKPGDDGVDAFVYVNSVHVFADDTVWCVDQGALRSEQARPGAQKIVQLDPVSGKILRVIRFDSRITPPGAKINDLRFYGSLMYVTDSGLGGLIVHDLETGSTRRRLSGFKEVLSTPRPAEPLKPGQTPIRHVTPKSDLIEISPDGEYLSWASPTGPFRRVRTAYLRDENMPDQVLASHVEVSAVIPLSGGSAMDTRGNLYLTDMKAQRILLMTPAGQTAVLAASPDLLSPDAPFISADRKLYIPTPQTSLTSLFGHPDETHAPFYTYVIQLPESFAGITLGDAVNGTPMPAERRAAR